MSLAVLLDDMPASLPLLQTLWGVTATEARRIGRIFLDRSLAQRDGEGSLGLHDLQLDYIHATFPDQEALRLIHAAVRLSAHVVAADPMQFASQIAGRLLVHSEAKSLSQGLSDFVARIMNSAPRPWIRAARPTLDAPGTALTRTLTASSCTFVSVSQDCRRVLASGYEMLLRIWDVETGREVRAVEGGMDSIDAVSPDWRRAISQSTIGERNIWDLDTGVRMRTIAENELARSYPIAVTPDGTGWKAISRVHDKGTLVVWDLESGDVVRKIHHWADDKPRWPVYCAVALNGRRAVITGRSDVFGRVSASMRSESTDADERQLTLWDIETGLIVGASHASSGEISCVAVARDGERVFFASTHDSYVTIARWDVPSGDMVQMRVSQRTGVSCMSVTPDGRRLVAGLDDGTVVAWDAEREVEGRILGAHSEVCCIAVTSDPPRAISGSRTEGIRVWDLEVKSDVRASSDHPGPITALAASDRGDRVVSASPDGTWKAWDLGGYRTVSACCRRSGALVAVSPNGRRALSAAANTINVSDLLTGLDCGKLFGPFYNVQAAAFTQDSRSVIAVFQDGTLKSWDIEAGREIRTIPGNKTRLGDVAISGDARLAVAAIGGHLVALELETGAILGKTSDGSAELSMVAVASNGTQAVAVDRDHLIKVWDIEAATVLRTIRFEGGTVTMVAISRDGKRLAVTSTDRTIRVLDLNTGDVLAAFTADAVIRCCVWTGPLLLAGDAAGRVHILEIVD